MRLKSKRNSFIENKLFQKIPYEDQALVKEQFQSFLYSFYPEIAQQICFERSEICLMIFTAEEEAIIYKVTYQQREVLFVLVDFPYVRAVVDMEGIEACFTQFTMIEKTTNLPVMPFIVFDTEREYETMISLYYKLPYGLALAINYLSIILEELE